MLARALLRQRLADNHAERLELLRILLPHLLEQLLELVVVVVLTTAAAAAAAPAAAAAAAASASPSPLPEHSDYYMCKMEGTRCEALTAAQRKDAGNPADADGQAQPAPGGEAADADAQKNSTAPVSEHSDYYMCKTEGKQCDMLSHPYLNLP